ncbi:hypothetical protein CRYUN_Cryun27aG0003100 [Craigia yunnanensis]
MSGAGKKVVDVAFKASKNIDWEGMAKLLAKIFLFFRDFFLLRNRGGFGKENCEKDKREEAGNGASWVNGGRGPCEGLAASQGSIGSQGSGS